MKTTFVLTALAALASAAELGIEATQEYICNRPTQNGDTIEVHYTGTLTSGKKFDSSLDRGSPFVFKLGAGRVIKGWDQGLLNMCVGDKRTLTVPPEFGYGNRGTGPIPGGSTLIFTTELMGIRGVEKEELVPKPSPSATEEATESATESATEEATESATESATETDDFTSSTTTDPSTTSTSASADPDAKQTTTIPADAEATASKKDEL